MRDYRRLERRDPMSGKLEDRLFVLHKDKWLDVCGRDYLNPKPASVTEVEDGIILPLQFRKDHVYGDFAFAGGYAIKTGHS